MYILYSYMEGLVKISMAGSKIVVGVCLILSSPLPVLSTSSWVVIIVMGLLGLRWAVEGPHLDIHGSATNPRFQW